MAKFTRELKAKFLEEYAKNDLHLTIACNAVGISRAGYYNARKTDFEFAKSLEDLEATSDDIIFNYLIEGLLDETTRLAYLKLFSSAKIDKIFDDRVKRTNKEIDIFELNKEDFTK